MTADSLGPQVRALFADLQHAGQGAQVGAFEQDCTVTRTLKGEAGREALGTRVRFVLTLADSRIVQARYQAYGCPHTLATCEWLSRRLEAGEAASLGEAADWCQALGVPIVKLGRLLVVEDALRGALENAAQTVRPAAESVVK